MAATVAGSTAGDDILPRRGSRGTQRRSASGSHWKEASLEVGSSAAVGGGGDGGLRSPGVAAKRNEVGLAGIRSAVVPDAVSRGGGGDGGGAGASVNSAPTAMVPWVVTGKALRLECLPLLTVVVGMSSIVLAIMAFYAEGFHREIPGNLLIKVPTVSHGGGWGMGKFIFTGGLHVACALFVITTWCVRGSLRLNINKNFDPCGRTRGESGSGDEEGGGRRLHRRLANGLDLTRLGDRDGALVKVVTSYWLACLSSALLFLAALVPMTYWGDLHNAFAAGWFLATLLYMKMINSVLSGPMKEVFLTTKEDLYWLRWKRGFFLGSWVFALLFVLVFPTIELNMPNMDCAPFTGESFCALESVRSCTEWAAAVCMFAWFSSLKHDIGHCKAELHGIARSFPSEPVY